MRLWTLHPKQLDRQGLLALWREGLLAQKVLRGKTKGYRNHPQLNRFRNHKSPLAAIATYLAAVCAEATRRGYHFDHAKILRKKTRAKISETTGQLAYEWKHLQRKLLQRHGTPPACQRPLPHPLFRIIPGGIQSWEKVKSQNKLGI